MFKDKIWSFLVVFVVLFPFSVNILIDGNNIFGISLVPTKPYFQDEVFFKLNKIKGSSYETIIMGSSAAGSLDPFVLAKYGFAKEKVYNLGISDASIYDLWKIFEFVTEKSKVKTVLLGIEYPTFNPSRLKKERKRNYNFQYFKTYIKNIFSTEAFLISKETIDGNRGSSKYKYMNFKNGQYVFGYPKPLNSSEPYFREVLRMQVKETLSNAAYLGDEVLKDFSKFKESFHYLDRILKRAKEKKIKLYLFAPLVHSVIASLIYEKGFTDAFEKWVRYLSKKHDLYCYLCSTTLRHNDNYFIDFVHLHPQASEMIFDIMFGNNPLKSEVFLTKQNVEQKISEIRDGVWTNYLDDLKHVPSSYKGK
jgi:hypothetical protein